MFVSLVFDIKEEPMVYINTYQISEAQKFGQGDQLTTFNRALYCCCNSIYTFDNSCLLILLKEKNMGASKLHYIRVYNCVFGDFGL